MPTLPALPPQRSAVEASLLPFVLSCHWMVIHLGRLHGLYRLARIPANRGCVAALVAHAKLLIACGDAGASYFVLLYPSCLFSIRCV